MAITTMGPSGVAARSTRRPGIPMVVFIPAVAVAAAVLLPLAYLIVRAVGAGDEAVDLLLRQRTLWTVLRTLALAVTVTGATVVVALPLAWLTVRTDLPFRRVWSVVTVLPPLLGWTVAAAAVPAAAAITCGPMTLDQATSQAYELLADATEEAIRFMKVGARVFKMA